MAGKNTRGHYFEESTKAFRGMDYLSALALFAAGLVAPLADPIADIRERWRKS